MEKNSWTMLPVFVSSHWIKNNKWNKTKICKSSADISFKDSDSVKETCLIDCSTLSIHGLATVPIDMAGLSDFGFLHMLRWHNSVTSCLHKKHFSCMFQLCVTCVTHNQYASILTNPPNTACVSCTRFVLFFIGFREFYTCDSSKFVNLISSS